MSAHNHPDKYAVLWDMDGTLINSAEMHFQAWQQLATGKGVPFTRKIFYDTFGRRNPDILRQLLGDGFSEAELTAHGEEKEEAYRQAILKHGTEFLPGAKDLVVALHNEGFLQAIGSSAPRKNIETIVEVLEMQAYFPVLIGMEDTEHGKPQPDVFLNAVRKLDVSPECCLVLEDAVAGVQAAKAGGMKCIAVSFVGHHGDEALKQAGADYVVGDLTEVSVEHIRSMLRHY